MITLFSREDSAYQAWQADLLRATFQAAGMTGTLAEVVHSPRHPYAGLHKIEDVTRWAASEPDSEETVLLIDPDFLFTAAFDLSVRPGHCVSQPLSYMHVPSKSGLLERYCRHPERVVGVGVPTALARCDWARIADPWRERTLAIREDPFWGPELNWVCDMWAFCLVLADLGITTEPRTLCAFPEDLLQGCPLIHYCYDLPPGPGFPGWSKRTHSAGADTPPPTHALPEAGRFLLRALRDHPARPRTL